MRSLGENIDTVRSSLKDIDKRIEEQTKDLERDRDEIRGKQEEIDEIDRQLDSKKVSKDIQRVDSMDTREVEIKGVPRDHSSSIQRDTIKRLVINLSVRNEELLRMVLQKDRLLRKLRVLRDHDNLANTELTKRLEILGLKLSRSEGTNGLDESSYEAKMKKLQEEGLRVRGDLQRSDKESLEELKRVDQEMQDRIESINVKIE